MVYSWPPLLVSTLVRCILPIQEEDEGEDDSCISTVSCNISSFVSILLTPDRYGLSRLMPEDFPLEPSGAIHVMGGGGGYDVDEELFNKESCTF